MESREHFRRVMTIQHETRGILMKSWRSTALLVLLSLLFMKPVLGQRVTATVAAGAASRAVALNPATNKIYVANANSNNVTVIDGATNTTTTVTAGIATTVAVNPVTNKIYVVNFTNNNVTVIDGVTNATSTVSAGTNPFAVAV